MQIKRFIGLGMMKGTIVTLLASALLAAFVSCSSSGAGNGNDNHDSPAPVFNHESGTYSSILILKMSCDTDDATILYTLDGTTPTASSTQYSGLVAIVNSTTVKAAAFRNGSQISAVSTETYTMTRYDRNPSSDGGAYYLKDGVKVYFDTVPNRDYVDIRGIFTLDSGSIFLFGCGYNYEYETVGSTTYATREDYLPCYWIDGVCHPLTIPGDCTEGVMNYSWGSKDGHVYLAGNVRNDTDSFPCYWKNNDCVVLDDEGATMDGITVAANGDVYVPGVKSSKPVCWKNTTAIPLEISASSVGSATHPYLDGDTVYVSGTVDGLPCYWKNANRVMLAVPSSSPYGTIVSVAPNNMRVVNGDLYVGGFVDLRKPDGGTYRTPMYWKNNMPSVLQIPGEEKATGGVWGFDACDNVAIPCGEWSTAQWTGDFCVLNGVVYASKRSH